MVAEAEEAAAGTAEDGASAGGVAHAEAASCAVFADEAAAFAAGDEADAVVAGVAAAEREVAAAVPVAAVAVVARGQRTRQDA